MYLLRPGTFNSVVLSFFNVVNTVVCFLVAARLLLLHCNVCS